MRQEEFEDRAHNISPEQIASLLSKLASEDNRWKYRKNIAFAENISPKRLKNAIKHFAHISTDETPLMLWDLTTFRSGKAGMLN
jgi:hypothetical protein